MTHLTPEQFVDLLERDSGSSDVAHKDASLDPASQHVATCDRCRAHLDDLRIVKGLAESSGSVPEPSPLFWDHFSARVHAAIAGSAVEPRWRIGRFAWTLGGAVACVVIVVHLTRPPRSVQRDSSSERARGSEQSQRLDAAETPDIGSDESWQLISDLTPSLDWEGAGEAGILRPGVSDRALLDLSDAERDELTRLLRVELERRKPNS